MPTGPHSVSIFVIGVDYGDKRKPNRWPTQPRRETWRPQRAIPDPAAHREMIRQLLEQTRDQRERLLEQAKATLAHWRLAA
jgi:hypothetical protein